MVFNDAAHLVFPRHFNFDFTCRCTLGFVKFHFYGCINVDIFFGCDRRRAVFSGCSFRYGAMVSERNPVADLTCLLTPTSLKMSVHPGHLVLKTCAIWLTIFIVAIAFPLRIGWSSVKECTDSGNNFFSCSAAAWARGEIKIAGVVMWIITLGTKGAV